MKNTVLFHIGYPKTATTFLQHKVFRKTHDVRFIHRATEPTLTKKIVSAARDVNLDRRSGLLSDIASGFKEFDREIIFSNENVLVTSRTLWEVAPSITPVIIARNIGILVKYLETEGFSCKVLLTVRRQDEWLAARFAQSGFDMGMTSQDDFERWVDGVINKNYENLGAWVDYSYVIGLLNQYVGAHRVFYLTQESLASNSSVWAERLEDLSRSKQIRSVFAAAHAEGRVVKSLKAGDSSWKLRDSDQFIELKESLKIAIMNVYAHSNQYIEF